MRTRLINHEVLDLKTRGIFDLVIWINAGSTVMRVTKPRDIRSFEEKPQSFVNLKLRYSEIPEVKTSDIASFGTFFQRTFYCKNHCALLYLSEG
jgi:hypothetical protein